MSALSRSAQDHPLPGRHSRRLCICPSMRLFMGISPDTVCLYCVGRSVDRLLLDRLLRPCFQVSD